MNTVKESLGLTVDCDKRYGCLIPHYLETDSLL